MNVHEYEGMYFCANPNQTVSFDDENGRFQCSPPESDAHGIRLARDEYKVLRPAQVLQRS